MHADSGTSESLNECSVCLEPIKGDCGIKTKCGHHFHHDCLLEWVLQDHKQQREFLRYIRNGGGVALGGSCPVCRSKLSNVFLIEKIKPVNCCTIS